MPLPLAPDAHQHAIDAANGSAAPDPAQVVAEHLHSGYMGAPVPLPSGKQERKKWVEAGRRLLRRLPDFDLRRLCYAIDAYWQHPDDFWRDKPCHDEALDLIARAYLQRQAAIPETILPPTYTEPSPLDALWYRALDGLQLQTTKDAFDTWLKRTYAMRRDNGRLVIGVPDQQVGEWLGQRLGNMILAAVREADPTVEAVKFEVERGREAA
jgi:hypothetical protein